MNQLQYLRDAAKRTMKNEKENTLVIIDPQYSFCNPNGELYVAGADEDMKRLGAFIEKNVASIKEIVVTKDNHSRYHIGFPSFWNSRGGIEPQPFTTLSLTEDNAICDEDGNEFFPRFQDDYQLQLIQKYLKTVKKHTIWPYHCVQNTIGNTIVEPINEALYLWEKIHRKKPIVLNKGELDLVEEYSIVQAENKCSDPNWFFLNLIKQSKIVYWAGEALSHCVNKSVRDTFNFHFVNGPQHSPQLDFNWFLIRDCSSPVAGYEKETEEFIGFCAANGINFTDSQLII